MFMYDLFCNAAEKIIAGLRGRKQFRGFDKLFDAFRVYRLAGLEGREPAPAVSGDMVRYVSK